MSATLSQQHVACGRCPICLDRPAWEVAAMVEMGWDQIVASRIVYGRERAR